jgi:hypothetical protein
LARGRGARRLGAMARTDSPFDPKPLREARGLLVAPSRTDGLGGLAAAAAFFAVSALALATTVVLMPTPWPK